MLSKTLALAVALFVCTAFLSVDGLKRERSGTPEKNAAKDALEGKAPPKLEMEKWMNVGDKPPTWKSMKGKVIILDFWAYW